MDTLRKLTDDLWVAEQPLRFAGLEMGARMTVVRIGQSELLLHSPIQPTAALCAALGAIGTVRYLVAPNKFHHLYVGDFASHYPDAEIFVAPGLEKKRADLTIAGVLPEAAPEAWDTDLEIAFIPGMPMVNEIAFFHRRSRTLIVCDLAFNIGPESPWLTRSALRLLGAYGRVSSTALERLLTRDRVAARTALRGVFAWDFERIIVAHGGVAERGGRQPFEDSYRWLLGAAESPATRSA